MGSCVYIPGPALKWCLSDADARTFSKSRLVMPEADRGRWQPRTGDTKAFNYLHCALPSCGMSDVRDQTALFAMLRDLKSKYRRSY